MSRVVSILWIALVVWVILPPPAQAQNLTDLSCTPTDDICQDDLWESRLGRFTIKSIKAVSDIPIYANPLLTITITINNRPSNPTWRLYSGYRDYNASQTEYCNLFVVGLADNVIPPKYVEYLTIPPNVNEFSVNVFGFCRDMNLPGTGGAAKRFPDSDFTAQASDFTRLDSTDLLNDLASIVRRANENTCGGERGLHSILSQFAVYILYTREDDRETIWRDFQEKARTPLYGNVGSENRTYIYCLLGETGIPAPAPTPPQPPPPTATAVVPLPPTNTPVPFLELPTTPLPVLNNIVTGLTIGQVLGIGIGILVGGVLFALLWLSLKPRQRLLVIASVAAISLAVIYLLINRPLPERTLPDDDFSPLLDASVGVSLDDESHVAD